MYPQGKSKELFEAISRVNKEAYASTIHLANHVLSKTPCCGLLERYELGAAPPHFTRMQMAGRVFRTWGVHLAVIGLMILARFAQASAGLNNSRELGKKGRKVTVVDIFILARKVLDEKRFKDNYLPGLPEALAKKGHSTVILARFYGTRNPRCLKKLFSILKGHNIPVITEYELFRFCDWLALLKFGFLFPLQTLRLAMRLGQDERLYQLAHKSSCKKEGGCKCPPSPLAYISSALIQCLGQNYMSGEARRLAARRLAALLPEGSRVISWYENQVVDKCFYRGLHEAGADVFTIGAQLLTWPSNLLNNHADSADGQHGAAPDLVLVNGPYFLPDLAEEAVSKEDFSVEVPGARPYYPYPGGPEYRIGPALRYKDLFETEIEPDRSAPVLMLLSYHPVETERVLQLAKPLAEKGVKLALRFHPATNWQAFAHLLPVNYSLAGGPIQSALEGASLVVGAGSGTLAEAVCMGLPVIAVEPEDGTGLNYLPDYGKGELWDSISRADGFFPACDRLWGVLEREPVLRQEKIKVFRSLMFTKPTEEAIIQAFEL